MGEIESMLVKNGEPFIQLDKEKNGFGIWILWDK